MSANTTSQLERTIMSYQKKCKDLSDRLAEAQAELEDLKRQYRCAYCESVDARIADAQARVERAEGALASVLGQDQTYSLSSVLKEFVTVANHLFDVHSCDHHGYEIWMQARDKAEHYLRTIANALTHAPQGRTDGEPWQISRAVDALEWAFSAVLLTEPRYANTESYQIHEATLNGLRGMIGKPVTAPEVKGGAA